MSVLYNLAVNPVMAYVALHMDDGEGMAIAPATIWAALLIASAVSCLGLIMAGCAMTSSHRHTFYKPRSFTELYQAMWEERTSTGMPDGTIVHGVDPSRADMIGKI